MKIFLNLKLKNIISKNLKKLNIEYDENFDLNAYKL